MPTYEYVCEGCGHEWAAKGRPDACPRCAGESLRQDEDVLDTWFSSWLWPFSAFGWPARSPDLGFYYPTHDLVTASEIIWTSFSGAPLPSGSEYTRAT